MELPNPDIVDSEPATDSLVLLPGTTLGGIEVVRLLGYGKVSESWFGVDTTRHSEVVIKALRQPWASDPVALKLFEKTLAGMATLKHPNLAAVLFSGFESDILFWTNEWVKGGAVAPRIRRKGPMDLVTACNAVDQAAAGLAYAKSMGVVHGGLKPENFLMEKSGAVKIADLGIEFAARRLISVAPGTAELWQTEWMAPEVRKGRAPDIRGDIYSLGTLLFFLLTGALPHEGETGSRVRIPGGVKEVLMRMLAPLPENRISDYGELRAMLANIEALQQDSTSSSVTVSWLADANEQAQTQPLDEPVPLHPAEPAMAPAEPLPAATKSLAIDEAEEANPLDAGVLAAPPPQFKQASQFQSTAVPESHLPHDIAGNRTGWSSRITTALLAGALGVAAYLWFTDGDPVAVEQPDTSIAAPTRNETESTQPSSVATTPPKPPVPTSTSSATAASQAAPPPTPLGNDLIIVDNATPGALELTPTSAWKPSAETRASYGNASMVALATGPVKTATFYVDVPVSGKYELHLWWVSRGRDVRSAAVPIIVQTSNGPVRLTISQVDTPSNFNPVGVFHLAAGERQPLITVTTENVLIEGKNVHVSVDAIKLTRVP